LLLKQLYKNYKLLGELINYWDIHHFGLFVGQHTRDPNRAFRAHNLADLTKGLSQHLGIQENQCIECQILSCGGDLSFGGKPSEKSIDLNGTEFLRVSQLIKTYEIADPVPVGLSVRML
jgi:hypothetical protein